MKTANRPPIRSMLFVPGHKTEWVSKATAAGPDAIILDLEDAVAPEAKADARRAVQHAIGSHPTGGPHLFVRLNGWGTGHLVADLRAAVHPGVRGVVLPKIDGADHVTALDLALTELELETGTSPGRIEIVPLPETPRAFRTYDAICAASPRVRIAVGVRALSSGVAGDLDRALGVDAPHGPDDDSYIDGHLSSCARAGGVSEVLTGPVADVRDVDLLSRSLQRARRLGATGSMVVHPSQIAAVHAAFAPTRAEVERAALVVDAIAHRRTASDAAVLVGGSMVDVAHVRSSLGVLERARDLALFPEVLAAVSPDTWALSEGP